MKQVLKVIVALLIWWVLLPITILIVAIWREDGI